MSAAGPRSRLLDPAHAADLVRLLQSQVTDTIWLGLMNNKAKERCVFERPDQETQLDDLLAVYRSVVMEDLYAAVRGEPKIRWKYGLRQRLRIWPILVFLLCRFRLSCFFRMRGGPVKVRTPGN